MADIGSTATFVIYITLSNSSGDLPSDNEIADLVCAQMDGELDDNGLECLGVSCGGVTGD